MSRRSWSWHGRLAPAPAQSSRRGPCPRTCRAHDLPALPLQDFENGAFEGLAIGGRDLQTEHVDVGRNHLASDLEARIGYKVRQMPTGAIFDCPEGCHGIEPRSRNAAIRIG